MVGLLRYRTTKTLVLALVISLTGCSGITADEGGIDVEAVLGDVRNCEQLLEPFVVLTSEAVGEIDRLAAAGSGNIDIGRAVESIEADRFLDGLQRLGCARSEMQADAVDRIRRLEPGTATGENFLESVLAEIERS